MTKEEYIEHLKELIAEDDGLKYGSMDQVIYQIDDLFIYGDFDCGSRGVDHNILKSDGIEWEQIFAYGTFVVPESRVYIAEYKNPYFEELGYEYEQNV